MATTTVVALDGLDVDGRRQWAAIVAAHHGRPSPPGDDKPAARFVSVADAVEAAVALQHALGVRGEQWAPRIGIHVVDIRSVDGDGPREGDAHVQSARESAVLAAAAGPGDVFVSDLARLLLDPAHSIEVEPVEPPIAGLTAWRVRWSTPPSVPKIRVVVAEDSVLVRAGLVRLLSEDGFEVVAEAGDHDGLLRTARQHRPDLVVTDVRMPPTQTDEGIRAAAVLRQEDAEVAVLVLSQHVEPAAAALLLSHNPTAVGYLLKERVSHLDEFIDACRQVASGGVVIDPLVTERLLQPSTTDHALNRLTDREREVLDRMAQGRSNAAIARELHCAAKTLESHVRAIFLKLDLPEDPDEHRRVGAVVRWLHATHGPP